MKIDEQEEKKKRKHHLTNAIHATILMLSENNSQNNMPESIKIAIYRELYIFNLRPMPVTLPMQSKQTVPSQCNFIRWSPTMQSQRTTLRSKQVTMQSVMVLRKGQYNLKQKYLTHYFAFFHRFYRIISFIFSITSALYNGKLAIIMHQTKC